MGRVLAILGHWPFLAIFVPKNFSKVAPHCKSFFLTTRNGHNFSPSRIHKVRPCDFYSPPHWKKILFFRIFFDFSDFSDYWAHSGQENRFVMGAALDTISAPTKRRFLNRKLLANFITESYLREIFGPKMARNGPPKMAKIAKNRQKSHQNRVK